MTEERREHREVSHSEDGMTVHSSDSVSESSGSTIHRDVPVDPNHPVGQTIQPGATVYTTPSGTTVQTHADPVATSVPASTGVSMHHSEMISTDPYVARRRNAYRYQQLIYLVFGIVEALLAFRFALSLLGANARSGFGQFIYGITDAFMAPFVGLFGTPNFAGSVFEWNALVAIIFYALVAWLLAKLVWLLMAPERSATHTETRHIDTHRD